MYNSFVWVVLGSFGISGAEKFAKNEKNTVHIYFLV